MSQYAQSYGVDEFIEFIHQSPSSFHAAHNVAQHFADLGFHIQDETQPWSASPGGHVLRRGGAVVAWYVPEAAGPTSGFRIVGSHTDSPGFMLKPTPDYSTAGFRQVAVEVYGGPILHSWFDRELRIGGELVLADGSTRLVSTGAVARIPNLAIHLYRKDEFQPDRQAHMQPIISTLKATSAGIMSHIAQSAGVSPADIKGFTLITSDAQRGEVFGTDGEFIAAGRMDNLSSVFATMAAFSQATQQDHGSDILVFAAFDHEEVGSASRTGAAGPLLSDVLTRTATALGANLDQFHQMLAASSCVSADAAHSVHPNYAQKHDPQHQPVVGGGPVLKINANQRYASDAHSEALWRRACEAAGVPHQDFVGNNSVPCGSTIGPITATRLGISTVDVGVPMLSMHSARELVGVQDQLWFAQALEAYLVG